jgi:hypothetical protein
LKGRLHWLQMSKLWKVKPYHVQIVSSIEWLRFGGCRIGFSIVTSIYNARHEVSQPLQYVDKLLETIHIYSHAQYTRTCYKVGIGHSLSIKI